MVASTLLTAPPAVEPMAPQKDEDQLSTKSRSSSFSQSSESSQSSFTYRKFRHHREPTVLDRPYVVESMRDALFHNDASALAQLVREHGLPPSMRSDAWPLLLKTHPYVEAALSNSPQVQVSDDELPIKRIQGDIRRLRRYRGPALLEDSIFNAIHSFLQTWGSRIPYDTAMVWIADFLASGDSCVSTPDLSTNSSGYSTGAGSTSASSSVTNSSHDLLSPISPTGFENAPFYNTIEDLGIGPETSYSFGGINIELLPEVFTHVMLIINHLPAEFSDFVAIMRHLLPELSRHFSHEGVLSGAGGGDDWLIWWLRWLGIRSFPAMMVSRLWDEYFAIRHEDDSVPLMRQHLFFCILLLKENRGKLTELDQSECRQYLIRVPQSRDMEVMIRESRSLAASQAITDS